MIIFCFLFVCSDSNGQEMMYVEDMHKSLFELAGAYWPLPVAMHSVTPGVMPLICMHTYRNICCVCTKLALVG